MYLITIESFSFNVNPFAIEVDVEYSIIPFLLTKISLIITKSSSALGILRDIQEDSVSLSVSVEDNLKENVIQSIEE